MKKDIALLLLRLTFGGLMLVNHGWGKTTYLFGDKPIEFLNFLGLGHPVSLGLTVFAEFICAGLVVLGLFTRWTVLPLIFAMLVAIFMVHWADPFADKEHAILYLAAYTAIGLLGPGLYSIDEQLARRKTATV